MNDRNHPKKSSRDGNLCATVDIPKIQPSQIDDLNSTKLGEGSYGHVIKCRFRQSSNSAWENIAIKYATDASHREILIREAKIILTHIRHPNCIRIFGFYECPKNGMGVAMELMDCSLAYLITNRTIEYKIDHAISWLYQLSDAMNYFHSRSHVHRDLKLQNLLLCNQYHTLKVCDFGTFTTLHESMTLNRGTPITMAPEIIKGSNKYTAKCDIYSFGIIMWQMIARRDSPYLASHPHDAYVIYWNIAAQNLRPPQILCNPIFSRFYERCWHDNPDKRPNSEQVMRYFSILKEAYPNGDDPVIDTSTKESPVTPQPTSVTPMHQCHRRGRSDQSTLIQTDCTRDRSTLDMDSMTPLLRNNRTQSCHEKLGSGMPLFVSQSHQMPTNVLDYIDHSLRDMLANISASSDELSVAIKRCLRRAGLEESVSIVEIPPNCLRRLLPADPIIGEEASEKIYNDHIAACHELYDHDLRLQQALSNKHKTIINLAHVQEYRKLMENKKQLEQLRDEALKKIQQGNSAEIHLL